MFGLKGCGGASNDHVLFFACFLEAIREKELREVLEAPTPNKYSCCGRGFIMCVCFFVVVSRCFFHHFFSLFIREVFMVLKNVIVVCMTSGTNCFFFGFCAFENGRKPFLTSISEESAVYRKKSCSYTEETAKCRWMRLIAPDQTCLRRC